MADTNLHISLAFYPEWILRKWIPIQPSILCLWNKCAMSAKVPKGEVRVSIQTSRFLIPYNFGLYRININNLPQTPRSPFLACNQWTLPPAWQWRPQSSQRSSSSAVSRALWWGSGWTCPRATHSPGSPPPACSDPHQPGACYHHLGTLWLPCAGNELERYSYHESDECCMI